MSTVSSGKPSGNGWQQEAPDNWLRSPDPWEVARPNEKVEINLACSFELTGGSLRPVPGRPSTLIGVPFDRPVIGYGGSTINTLRLWAAAAPDYFDFEEFSHGDFVEALHSDSLGRNPDAGPLSRRFRFQGASITSFAGVFPCRLFPG